MALGTPSAGTGLPDAALHLGSAAGDGKQLAAIYLPPCLGFPFGKHCCLCGDVAEKVPLVEGGGLDKRCPAFGLAA